MTATLLVTGATGNVGSTAVTELIAAGHRPRVLVRDLEKVPRAWSGLDVIVGDYADRSSLVRAMSDIERALLITADGPAKVLHERALVDAAAEAGVAHLVKLSAQHAAAGHPLPCFDWHGQADEYLAASGIPYTLLRPTFFMENMLMVAPGVAENGVMAGPTAGRRTAMIAISDVGASAAAALTESQPRHATTYELTGPAAVTFAEFATAVSSETGRVVRYVDLSPEEAQPRFEAGKPVWLAAHLSGVFGLIRSGGFEQVTDDVHRLLGRPARSIEDFARTYAGAFAPARVG